MVIEIACQLMAVGAVQSVSEYMFPVLATLMVYFRRQTDYDQEHAAEAYDIAAIKFRGKKAITNFDTSRYDAKAIMNSTLPVGRNAKRSRVEEQDKESIGENDGSPYSLFGLEPLMWKYQETYLRSQTVLHPQVHLFHRTLLCHLHKVILKKDWLFQRLKLLKTCRL
ncbi:hypothetical protein SUGI_0871690 [Cryptomeria japonica]|nr:hypothetical protein SUGI_0871690 [Cryptomeria japonica]